MTKTEFIQRLFIASFPTMGYDDRKPDKMEEIFSQIFIVANRLEGIAAQYDMENFFEGDEHVNPLSKFDKISVCELEVDPSISRRFRYACEVHNIQSMGDLIRFGSKYFEDCRYIGDKTIKMIKDQIQKQYNYKWL